MITFERVQQKVSHGAQKVPWLTLALSALVGIFYLSGSRAFEFLVFDKEAILRGEIWRFFTGHFVHFGFEHFIWDFLALIILGAVIELNDPRKLAGAFLTSCMFVSTWLIFGGGGKDTYCGLSGALSGLLVVAVFVQYQVTHNKISFLVLLGAFLKIVFELLSHKTLFVVSVSPVPTVHFTGFISGFLYSILMEVVIKSKAMSIGDTRE